MANQISRDGERKCLCCLESKPKSEFKRLKSGRRQQVCMVCRKLYYRGRTKGSPVSYSTKQNNLLKLIIPMFQETGLEPTLDNVKNFLSTTRYRKTIAPALLSALTGESN